MKLTVLDIGGTSIKSGVYRDGCLHEIEEHATEAEKGGSCIVSKICQIIMTKGICDGIGISTAGQVDNVTGTIIHANDNLPGYTGIQLGKILNTQFGVPVAVENDVNAAALGEGHFGAGQGEKNYLCLTYGTGVGGAIVINGELYRGFSGSAGEFGSMIIHGEEAEAGRRISGSYENYASTKILVRKVQEVNPEIKTGRQVFSNLDRPWVHQIVDEWIDEIAHGLVTLIHVFNPGCVILGGGVMKQPYVVEAVKKNVLSRIMPSFAGVKICPAALENRAGLWGAVYLAEKKARNIVSDS